MTRRNNSILLHATSTALIQINCLSASQFVRLYRVHTEEIDVLWKISRDGNLFYGVFYFARENSKIL